MHCNVLWAIKAFHFFYPYYKVKRFFCFVFIFKNIFRVCVCQYSFIIGQPLWWQEDHFTAKHLLSSCKSNKAYNQSMPHPQTSLVFECKCWALLCVLAFVPASFLLFSVLPLSFFSIVLAVDGEDGMGWIFNRFVSGSTMEGEIVVNIIRYWSLQLHFPRPCHTEAITRSSQPHHCSVTFRAPCTACLCWFNMFISYDPFNLPCIPPFCNEDFIFTLSAIACSPLQKTVLVRCWQWLIMGI